ncbi:MAG: hypothetical protein F9K18_09715, partial [Thermoanaerobaculia bacterium]
MRRIPQLACSLFLVAASIARAQTAPPADPAPAVQVPPAAPAGSFGEIVKATAVTVTIDVRDAAGRVPADLAAKDFAVLEDGQLMPVLAVERIAVP